MRVIGGKPLRKNRYAQTPRFRDSSPRWPAIRTQRPGRDYRHLVHKRDVEAVLPLLPRWDVLSEGLEAIVLAPGEWGTDARYTSYGQRRVGRISLCAWDREVAQCWGKSYVDEHRPILDLLSVPVVPAPDSEWLFDCQFTEHTARAFQLIHVLVHELGHHHDRLHTASRRGPARGERYAERYANDHEALLVARYQEHFRLD
jgi:hypothetical protein